ncbi:hypothetical protein JCM10908_004008 [Rhodotorula pacifica]|uniref:uncharacterized protein n=1 Tax=Rhodotorula pacifica TaxID=1495444 RepID=UPI00316CDF89
MRVNVLHALALVLASFAAQVLAADLSGLIASTSSTASSASASASASASNTASGSSQASSSASGSNSPSSSSGSSSATVSQSVIVSQSLSVNGSQTMTYNVTRTSTMTATTPLTTAATPQGLESITAYAPGQTISGVGFGPNDGYIAAAGRADIALTGAAGAVFLAAFALLA